MKIFKIIAVTLFVAIIVFVSLIITQLSPKNANASEKRELVVTEGQKSAEIAQALETEGLIRNSFAFYVYLKLINGKILPGIYELSAAESASDIANRLASGKVKVARITIIEGWRARQMEEYLIEEKNLPQFEGFTELAEPFEGYLFPDTYEVKLDITKEELITLMRETFTQKTKALTVTAETVILASIVEREAQSDSDRPMIAGVYANRVKQGIKLEADPTIQYGKGDWVTVTVNDYKNFQSPYNTYIHEGWPPGPIASPGLKSLQAAADPADHEYVYFFHAKGETHFSKTYSEHQAKVRQYFR